MAYLLEKQLLGPRDAVHGLVGVVANRADRVGLLVVRLGLALVALGLALLDDGHLPEVTLRARLDERDARGQAYAVDVPARVDVVERVEHDREALEVVEVELRRLDVAVVRLDLRPLEW
jgi:hypothetical protein